tara:strand:+ start:154 stop:255 length:102 start_codon:yes stop_codon:yes gene_type:complete
MPGELDKVTEEKRRVKKANQAVIDMDAIRERGF